jgi:hypothetical protein
MAYREEREMRDSGVPQKGPGADRLARRLKKQERRDAIRQQEAEKPVPGSRSIGTLQFPNTYSNYSADELPIVSDPDATFASVAEGAHERYIRNFRDFERRLLDETDSTEMIDRDSTELVDAAMEDIPQQTELARGIAQRNRERYGYQQTAAERQEAEKMLQLGGALNLAGGLNNARLAQRDANRFMLGNLINIGQGVNRSSMRGLGSAAQNAAARQQAFQNDRAAYKQQTAGFLGKLGSALASFI